MAGGCCDERALGRLAIGDAGADLSEEGIVAAGEVELGGRVDGYAEVGGRVEGREEVGGRVDGSVDIGGRVEGEAVFGDLVWGEAVAGGLVWGEAVVGGLVWGEAVVGGRVWGEAVFGGRVEGEAVVGGLVGGGREDRLGDLLPTGPVGRLGDDVMPSKEVWEEGGDGGVAPDIVGLPNPGACAFGGLIRAAMLSREAIAPSVPVDVGGRVFPFIGEADSRAPARIAPGAGDAEFAATEIGGVAGCGGLVEDVGDAVTGGLVGELFFWIVLLV